MNRIEKLLLRGAGFSVLFMLIYFTLAAIMGFEQINIGAGRFFLILLFGYVLAMANFIFDSVRINVWLKRLSVYAISALAFLFIFVLGGAVGTTGAKIFAALIIFTAIYAVGLAVALLIGRTIKSASPKGGKSDKPEDKKKKYKSLYED